MIRHDRCPLCSSEKTGLYLKCTDFFISGESFDIHDCRDCGFLFTQEYPSEETIHTYYESEDYISHSDTPAGIVNKLYHLARSIMLRRKRRLIGRLTGLTAGRLLDVGSGTGHFAAVMMKSGWQVTGIEISDKAGNYASSRFGVEVVKPVDVSGLQKASYDCVTMWHVLEHFHRPGEYMTEILDLLKPGGYCLVALPNSGSFDAGYYGQHWAAYDVPRHLWHFNPHTLRLFAGKAGLSVIGQVILPFDVFYISIMSEKYRKTSFYFLAGGIKGLFFYIRSLFNPEKSSSVLYILKRL